MADVSSSEFIKGYTKIILCDYLYKGRNYLYAVIKQLLKDGHGYLRITNPSALMIMKEMEAEGFVTFELDFSETNLGRKYFTLTEAGKEFYLKNRDGYANSLKRMQSIIMGREDDKSER